MRDDPSEMLVQQVLDQLVELRGFLELKFEGIETRLDRVEIRMTAVEGRLTGVETRLDRVEIRLTSVEERLSSLEGEWRLRRKKRG